MSGNNEDRGELSERLKTVLREARKSDAVSPAGEDDDRVDALLWPLGLLDEDNGR